ncbi:MAG: serine/threonine-protein kinase, partial [Bryobacteraceae bacterium]
MAPERFQQVEQLYHESLERDPGARSAFLEQACGPDLELRQEVESLLALEDQAADFIEAPAMQVAAKAMAAAQVHHMVGRRIAAYEIVSLLGAGGMGEVYRARDTVTGRVVALKILPPAFSSDAERLKRFQQEARAAGMLNHPNILTLYAVGTHEGSPYMVTELLEGETLRDRLRADKPGSRPPLTPTESAGLALSIARALAVAHDKGVFHRDLKPENIFLTLDGGMKILDFGLAKLARPMGGVSLARTKPGTILGSSGYMSPEQVRGESADHRADLFSLGAMLYEMLSGAAPFPGKSAIEAMQLILTHEPPTPAVSPALGQIMRRCL